MHKEDDVSATSATSATPVPCSPVESSSLISGEVTGTDSADHGARTHYEVTIDCGGTAQSMHAAEDSQIADGADPVRAHACCVILLLLYGVGANRTVQ
jgi:hypothetical protein